ncbi:hypothetical protein [Priestia aryabhattai]|uniref:hypothetical protein n=1 Tax=Priestia aryabhattai TaxID=412384 RepID=UPI00265B0713|nr:hypothetical protein [Priestia aryabhattai]WKG33408.1 hypothetical protein QYS54_26545 [Priestia aryabhattai]
MHKHLILPIKEIEKLEIKSVYRDWLEKWYHDLEAQISNGDLAVSNCYQGIITEIILYGKIKTDWLGVLDNYLTADDSMPLAYSETFGKRLYNFNAQWKQSPVHALYTHWWIRGLFHEDRKREELAEIVPTFIQSNGWIYNPNVSETQIRTRMKSELMMSLTMGAKILKHHNQLDKYKERLLATINGFSYTGYVSAEHFRTEAYKILDFKGNPLEDKYNDLIKDCVAVEGYSDFSIHSKVDDYMGTAKRTQRDKPIDSPLISMYVYYLSQSLNESSRELVKDKLRSYGQYLSENPMNIPAFRMRDINIPFGTDITPLEVISSSYLVEMSKHD